MRFKLRSLLIVITVFAILSALWATYARYEARDTIFHSEIDATIEFPSGRSYRTNRWYSHRPHLDQFEMLVVSSNQYQLLSESEESANTTIDLKRIARIQMGQKRFGVAVEKFSHNTDGIDQYWISLGKQIK